MPKILHHTITADSHPHLFALPRAPKTLQLRGTKQAIQTLEHLPHAGLAIVGTRRPSDESKKYLRKLFSQLKGSRLTIVSGVAHGIDTFAHELAIENKLATIGVLAFGHEFPYSSHSKSLREHIIRNDGLLVSEYSDDIPARPYQFLLRNRIIAHWSLATLVIEAAKKSGTLNTAKWAREADRTVFAVPCFPDDPNRQGNQMLIDDYQAYPLWAAHSLGIVWLDLACRQET